MGSDVVRSTLAAVIIVLAFTVVVNAQFPSRYPEKPGSCSPPSGVGICAMMCKGDFECPGTQKCCLTACGGTSCSKPVSRIVNASPIKPGRCPTIPTGPWVCSHTCTTDADCRGKLKCCRNRCDALACQKPEP